VSDRSEFFRNVLETFFARCKRAKECGGIPLTDVFNGRPVPDGWVLDIETQYYLPGNLVLL
jgi:hypothetical protein